MATCERLWTHDRGSMKAVCRGFPLTFTNHQAVTVRPKALAGAADDRRLRAPVQPEWGAYMLWTIAVVLLVLWLLGLVTSYTMGGFIHILLVVAIIVVLIRIIQGRKVL